MSVEPVSLVLVLCNTPIRRGPEYRMGGESPEVIRAAGGIVMGVRRNSGKIAIIRRRRHGGDIGLPKGKLKAGESEAEAALREVGEETGFRVAVRQAAGTTHYSVDGQPKAVAYFM